MEFYVTGNSNPLCTVTTIKESSRAAEILCTYLNKITNGNFAVLEAKETNNILFSMNDKFSESGFSYEVSSGNLVISASCEKGFVYAVYDLLERLVGCRYLTSTTDYIPSIKSLTLDVTPYEFEPPIYYREIYYEDYEDEAFAEKLKMSPSGKHDGWGFWCHSFQILLPNDVYYNEHPEYFALIDGERHPKGEPCLSNPEVQAIIIENLREHIEKNPQCKYWSISQNDDNLYCRCEKCSKLDEVDGGPMGSILNFVNKVAGEFPDKVISTLAYWYSRKPPKVTRPAENVHIMLCNIEANRGMPIATDERNIGSKEEFLDWAEICENVSLWDYNIQFANLVSPFPNLRTLGPNMRFFVENNLKLLFSQCNRDIGGEFSELRGYMLAKLAWNPSCNETAVMEDFCNHYYGQASSYVLKYIDEMHNALESTDGYLNIFNGPKDAKNTYLTMDLYNNYNELFDAAESTVSHDEALLLRVQTARLPLYYAGIELEYGTHSERLDIIEKFAKLARKTNLHKVEEWKITVDKFLVDSLAKL